MARLITKKANKEEAKKYDMRFPDSCLEALDAKVAEIIKMAAKRAEANGRKTLKEYDL
jgi:histone H3/H4